LARKSIVYASIIMIIAAGVLFGAFVLKGASPSSLPPVQTPVVQTLATLVPTPVQTPPHIPTTVTTSPTPAQGSGNGLMTCAQQGGTITVAGQTTTGTWLDASDTFSCSSIKPTLASKGNQTISITTFNLTIIQNDDLGTIVP
jgi:hypothetical protein